jgi:tyrosyl-tRNA synthetase
MALFWMYLHGFKAVTLVGAATAQIGDPTWRTIARNQMAKEERLSNVSRMETQLNSMWSNVATLGSKYGYEQSFGSQNMRNNQDWLSKVSMLEALQVMGGGLRMGSLLSRDSVKARLDSDDGMAFSEFCYPILQAWDWWHMKQHDNVLVQIGGADQFGNIITGIEALKHLVKRNVHSTDTSAAETKEQEALMGFTVPLLTTSSGEKFGKSAGNAVWLDPELTSPFDLYAVCQLI